LKGIDTVKIGVHEVGKILEIHEGHFADLKSIDIAPAKLTKSLSAFSNAEGGELFIGIEESEEETGKSIRLWRGFSSPEAANGFVQAFEEFFPLGQDYTYTFLWADHYPGFVLKVDIRKSRDIRAASDKKVYIRRSAQNLPVDTEEGLARLRRNKGITSYETESLNASPDVVSNSEEVIRFMLQVVPTAEPEEWLHKQQLIQGDKPPVAGVLLFADEPQALLPKRSGIKIYRYQTSDEQGTRETLQGDPISIEGSLYHQIHRAVIATAGIVESVRVNTPKGLESVRYPATALHEVITNAVLHRDYSIADDIHIRVFDNRVEVLSPGTLPGHITPENILDERFARNGVLVRLINKFPDPPNKDVGEGLNTAFEAMREMRLKPPIIALAGQNVKVSLRHEPLETPEELVLEYLQTHEQIANRQARDICFIGSENKMKTIFQRMIKQVISDN
jgi:ATP-dependent DNA helicase RecG